MHIMYLSRMSQQFVPKGLIEITYFFSRSFFFVKLYLRRNLIFYISFCTFTEGFLRDLEENVWIFCE